MFLLKKNSCFRVFVANVITGDKIGLKVGTGNAAYIAGGRFMRFDVRTYLLTCFDARCNQRDRSPFAQMVCKFTSRPTLHTVKELIKIVSLASAPLQQKKNFLRIYPVRRWKNDFS
jgi:hypothetical protein